MAGLCTGDRSRVEQPSWEVRQLAAGRPGFEEQYAAVGVLAEASRRRGARGTGPDHDHIDRPVAEGVTHGSGLASGRSSRV
jgi:hypothetical protein